MRCVLGESLTCAGAPRVLGVNWHQVLNTHTQQEFALAVIPTPTTGWRQTAHRSSEPRPRVERRDVCVIKGIKIQFTSLKLFIFTTRDGLMATYKPSSFRPPPRLTRSGWLQLTVVVHLFPITEAAFWLISPERNVSLLC